MATSIKPKKITHTLDDKAKTRLTCYRGGHDGYVSSGSEHSGYGGDDDDDDSPCLSELIQDFFQLDDHVQTTTSTSTTELLLFPNDSESAHVEQSSYSIEKIKSTLELYINNNADSYKKLLSFHVAKAIEECSCLKNDMQIFRKNIMVQLRKMGHNAAICKTRWDSSGGLTAGNYEFIDVLNGSMRYFLDLNFVCEFKIARATDEYLSLLKVLPSVFVGSGEDLKKIVKLMCDEAKRSLKKRELSLPPWRKNRFVQNKWFASYRRTMNPVHGTAMFPVNVVMCQQVGFDDGFKNCLFVKTR